MSAVLEKMRPRDLVETEDPRPQSRHTGHLRDCLDRADVPGHRVGPIPDQRLLEEVEGPAARGVDGVGNGGVAGDHHGRRRIVALADRGRYARLAASGFRLAPPVAIFPRLEAPAD